MNLLYEWTDGSNQAFKNFYLITESYYNKIVGGENNRESFKPYNASNDINDVLIVYNEEKIPIACASFKKCSDNDAEVKRVWVEPQYRGHHIAKNMMDRIENRVKEKGYKRIILQTREIMEDAVGLYTSLGYKKIANYFPYNKMDSAICFAKEL